MTNGHLQGRVTKRTPLDSPVEWSAGKAGFGTGKMATAMDSKRVGAITARSTRMNPDPMRRAMRPNRGVNRRLTVRFVDPATLEGNIS